MEDAISKVYQYTLASQQLGSIERTGIGNMGGFDGKACATKTYFTFANYSTPAIIFSLDK
jgi:prolyl oligopeptidase